MPRPRHHVSSHDAAERLAATAPLVTRWIERLLSSLDPPLTVAQYLVLQAVESGEVGGAELARRAAVSAAAISQVVGGLETAGLLERERVPADRRRQAIALTRDGRKALGAARALLRDRLSGLLGGLRGPEADALARLLGRVEETLAGIAPPPRPHPPRPGPPRRRA
ncbi:MAG TPA: MarR family winged helix-turn-helix transcriptional regulator [Gaiellaceae bacterium]|nr:MarR family winged helix-turn-helix transcriptional regulator [Gaiellaceae bacterium]